MRLQSPSFSSKTVDYYFDADFSLISEIFGQDNIVIITDENVFAAQVDALTGYNIITIPAGETNKKQPTVDKVIDQLLAIGADRKVVIVGVGGGVVTDIAGYVASIYKRGVKLVQVPTSVLAMVDAAIGGKNGVDVGLYKNQVGTIYQPEMVLFDYRFLQTLPKEEWVHGFAEIIKHACIKDAEMFDQLKEHVLEDYMQDVSVLAELIERNVAIKLNVVLNDEHETGDRKLLNFGHTIGHAIEAAYDIPHGQSISIGMVAAGKISIQESTLDESSLEQLIVLLKQYGLPVMYDFDKEKIWSLLLNDKKREKDQMSFILLEQIGKGIVKEIPLDKLEKIISDL